MPDNKVYICERCNGKYKLDQAFFYQKNSKGQLNKMYSPLSYKYCFECLPYYEKDAIKVDD